MRQEQHSTDHPAPVGGGGPWRKVAGILVEASAGSAVVGIGCNVDWRGADPPADIADVATSLAEVGDLREPSAARWRLLEDLLGIFCDRYLDWCQRPTAFLDDYRARCSTIGRAITARRPSAEPLSGVAEAVTSSGALLVRTEDGRAVEVSAGDVTHVR